MWDKESGRKDIVWDWLHAIGRELMGSLRTDSSVLCQSRCSWAEGSIYDEGKHGGHLLKMITTPLIVIGCEPPPSLQRRDRRKELIVVSSKEGVYACLCGRALRGSWPFGRRCICPTRHTMSLLYFVYSRAIHLLVLLLLFCKKCVRSIVRLLFCSLIRSLILTSC